MGGDDRIRAVHDVRGHAHLGVGLDRNAEFTAWRWQERLHSPRPAWRRPPCSTASKVRDTSSTVLGDWVDPGGGHPVHDDLGRDTIAAAAHPPGRRVRPGRCLGCSPWLARMLGLRASLAANVAAAEPTVVGRLVAAWAPPALALSFELLLRQTRGER